MDNSRIGSVEILDVSIIAATCLPNRLLCVRSMGLSCFARYNRTSVEAVGSGNANISPQPLCRRTTPPAAAKCTVLSCLASGLPGRYVGSVYILLKCSRGGTVVDLLSYLRLIGSKAVPISSSSSLGRGVL